MGASKVEDLAIQSHSGAVTLWLRNERSTPTVLGHSLLWGQLDPVAVRNTLYLGLMEQIQPTIRSSWQRSKQEGDGGEQEKRGVTN